MASTSVRTTDLDEAASLQTGSFTKLRKIAAPFTTVVNRALCVDPSNDGLVKFGINRIPMQVIQEVEGEFGPTGQRVFKLQNDPFDQVRFVGAWKSVDDTTGQFVYIPTGLNDFFEITFYGTGLNLLTNDSAGSLFVAVDNGAEGADFFINQSAVIYNRNYSPNNPISVVQGLTVGTHTVRIRVGSSSDILLYGYEIVTATAGLQVVPSTILSGGKRLYSPGIVNDPYNSNFETGTLGSRGGRVSVYQKADGTIRKSVRPADAAAAYLSSASHANESIAQKIHWREFGSGRLADDLSIATGNISSRAFTLDDGTTTLTGSNVATNALGNEILTTLNISGSAINITFVGTGLDVIGMTDGATRQFDSVSVDAGASVGVLSMAGAAPLRRYPIVSGLPYGTHTVRFAQTSATYPCGIKEFLIYAPAKPVLPAGAVEIADYCVMATYVASTTISSLSTPYSTGILAKSPVRELTYVGASWGMYAAGAVTPAHLHGFDTQCTTAGDYFEYVFFGTGIELHTTYNSTPWTATVRIDGAAYTGAATVATVSTPTPTWTPGTSTFLTGGAAGAALQISGLTLGWHKVRLTKVAAGDAMIIAGLSVITPVHTVKDNVPGTVQATMAVGSQSIRDTRLFPVLSAKPVPNWAQAIGVVATPTSSVNTVIVPIPDLVVKIRTTGNPIEISYSLILAASASIEPGIYIYVDGVQVGTQKYGLVTSTSTITVADSFTHPVSAGFHLVQLFWGVGGTGTINSPSVRRNLTVREI